MKKIENLKYDFNLCDLENTATEVKILVDKLNQLIDAYNTNQPRHDQRLNQLIDEFEQHALNKDIHLEPLDCTIAKDDEGDIWLPHCKNCIKWCPLGCTCPCHDKKDDEGNCEVVCEHKHTRTGPKGEYCLDCLKFFDLETKCNSEKQKVTDSNTEETGSTYGIDKPESKTSYNRVFAKPSAEELEQVRNESGKTEGIGHTPSKEPSGECKHCGLPKNICRIAELAAFAKDKNNPNIYEKFCDELLEFATPSPKVDKAKKIAEWLFDQSFIVDTSDREELAEHKGFKEFLENLEKEEK